MVNVNVYYINKKRSQDVTIILKIVHQMQTIFRKDKSKIIQKCNSQFQYVSNKSVSSEPLFQKKYKFLIRMSPRDKDSIFFSFSFDKCHIRSRFLYEPHNRAIRETTSVASFASS